MGAEKPVGRADGRIDRGRGGRRGPSRCAPPCRVRCVCRRYRPRSASRRTAAPPTDLPASCATPSSAFCRAVSTCSTSTCAHRHCGAQRSALRHMLPLLTVVVVVVLVLSETGTSVDSRGQQLLEKSQFDTDCSDPRYKKVPIYRAIVSPFVFKLYPLFRKSNAPLKPLVSRRDSLFFFQFDSALMLEHIAWNFTRNLTTLRRQGADECVIRAFFLYFTVCGLCGCLRID